MTFRRLLGQLRGASVLISGAIPAEAEATRALLAPYTDDISVVAPSDCLEAVAQHLPDLVLLRTNPELSQGLEPLAGLRKHAPTKDLLVLVAGSSSRPEDIRRVLEAGADEVVADPVEPVELLARVQALLRLDDSRRKLREAQRALNLDLRLARRLQRALLPDRQVSRPGLEIHAAYLPCERIGGDFYDILPLSSSSTGIFVGDVVGHGIPAALLTAALKAQLVDLPHRPKAPLPGEVLTSMNQTLARMLEAVNLFITGVYLEVDPDAGELKYACAGHPAPLIQDPEGRISELQGGGLPLGLEECTGYETFSLALPSPGSRILIYTDGLPEQPDRWGERPFGILRVYSLMQKCRGRSLRAFVESLQNAIRSWRGRNEQMDDINLVALEFQAPGPSPSNPPDPRK